MWGCNQVKDPNREDMYIEEKLHFCECHMYLHHIILVWELIYPVKNRDWATGDKMMD